MSGGYVSLPVLAVRQTWHRDSKQWVLTGSLSYVITSNTLACFAFGIRVDMFKRNVWNRTPTAKYHRFVCVCVCARQMISMQSHQVKHSLRWTSDLGVTIFSVLNQWLKGFGMPADRFQGCSFYGFNLNAVIINYVASHAKRSGVGKPHVDTVW